MHPSPLTERDVPSAPSYSSRSPGPASSHQERELRERDRDRLIYDIFGSLARDTRQGPRIGLNELRHLGASEGAGVRDGDVWSQAYANACYVFTWDAALGLTLQQFAQLLSMEGSTYHKTAQLRQLASSLRHIRTFEHSSPGGLTQGGRSPRPEAAARGGHTGVRTGRPHSPPRQIPSAGGRWPLAGSSGGRATPRANDRDAAVDSLPWGATGSSILCEGPLEWFADEFQNVQVRYCILRENVFESFWVDTAGGGAPSAQEGDWCIDVTKLKQCRLTADGFSIAPPSISLRVPNAKKHDLDRWHAAWRKLVAAFQ